MKVHLPVALRIFCLSLLLQLVEFCASFTTGSLYGSCLAAQHSRRFVETFNRKDWQAIGCLYVLALWNQEHYTPLPQVRVLHCPHSSTCSLVAHWNIGGHPACGTQTWILCRNFLQNGLKANHTGSSQAFYMVPAARQHCHTLSSCPCQGLCGACNLEFEPCSSPES